MKKRMFVMIALVLLVVASIAAIKIADIKKQMAAGAVMMSMPSVVSTTKAVTSEWMEYKQAIGSVRAAKGVDIASEVPGIVQEISFNSGQDVKEGAPLLKLRADDEIAKLHTLEAAQKLAEINLARDRKQMEVQAVSQSTIDNDTAALAVARAQVAEQQAVIAKKTISAPFSGKLGIRNVDLGQYVTPGMALVTLQSLDSVFLDFSLPQQDVAEIKSGQKVRVHTDAYPGHEFIGEVTAVNAKVEASTRNAYVRATIENAQHKLLPGMFASVEVATREPQKAITLPQTAVAYSSFGATVYVVDEDKNNTEGKTTLVARQVFVKTGETRGDQVAIVAGLQEGDTVVVSGQVKIHNGSHLEINNSVLPSNDKNPLPEDK